MMPASPWIGSIRTAAPPGRGAPPLGGGEIAERSRAKVGREWSKAVAVVGLGREGDDGRGAAVEIPCRDDDLGAVTGDTLDAITPAARRLARGLGRPRA